MNSVNYRSTLATDLNKKRNSKRIPFIQKSGKQLAENLLQEEQKSATYVDAEIFKYRSLLADSKNENFTKRFNKDIAIKLIRHGDSDVVAKHIDKFKGSDHNSIAKRLIDFNDGGYVVANLDKFQGLNHQETALNIIENQRGEYVAANLDKFQGLDHQEIATKLFEHGKGRAIAQNLDKFQGLDEETLQKAIKDWEKESLKHSLKSNDKKTIQKPAIKQETTWEYIKKHPIIIAALAS